MFCIPIIAKNTDEALEKIGKVNALADVVEIRLDMMDAFDLDGIIQAARKPVLVTYRSKKEGGKGGADAETHTGHILTAIQKGADLVDVELSLPLTLRERIFDNRGKSGIVISTHIPDVTPSREELGNIFQDQINTGAGILKIVTKANTWTDNFRVLELIPEAHDAGVKIVAFCMGPMGRISRIFSHLMGSYLTFASFDVGEESAAGQIPITEMKRILEHFSI